MGNENFNFAFTELNSKLILISVEGIFDFF